jgi:hypothetical protein
MQDIFDLIREDELTDDLLLISRSCGVDVVRKLLKYMSGLAFYIPKMSRMDKFVNRYFRENSNKSIKQIANELGVSEQYLRCHFKTGMKNEDIKSLKTRRLKNKHKKKFDRIYK